ncbi:head-tail adaptor [Cellulophaga phage phi39:1]|uniref:head-tail adaptor n=1 Tax=Cellulophaga phage phi39:1 TaxID=1327993 RepID=UPI00035186D9|nr:head-tail adaptor [Cellulophaga phage phi39:1]AGO49129.1 structural protein [Cellulophaga phage phi39:1]
MEYYLTYGEKIGSTEVVSLALAKSNSKIIWDDEDDLLQLFLDASINDAENYIDAPIAPQNIAISYSGFDQKITFPGLNISALSSIEYLDVNGDTKTLDNSKYIFYVNATDAKVNFLIDSIEDINTSVSFPLTFNVVAGFSVVPPSIIGAILLRFGHKHQFREDMPTNVDRSFQAALRTYKRF